LLEDEELIDGFPVKKYFKIRISTDLGVMK